MNDGPGTPGFWGYVLAFGIGFAVFGAMSGFVGTDPVGISPLDTLLLFGFFGLWFYGIPFLLVGVVVAPAISACRLLTTQHSQVAAAALTALPFAYLLSRIAGDGAEQQMVFLGLPLAMAIGRAAVIPIAVERGRR